MLFLPVRREFSIIVTAPSHTPTETSTSERSRTVRNMAKVPTHTSMEEITLGNTGATRNMAKVPSHGPMEPSTLENTRTASGMAKASTHLTKENMGETSTSGSGRTTKDMVKASTHGPMDASTLASIVMTYRMGRVDLRMPAGQFIPVSLTTANPMAKGYKRGLMGLSM